MDGLVSPNPICDMIRHNSLQCVSLYVVIISDFTSIKSYNGDTLYETAVLLSICPRKCIGGGSGRERWGENALPVQKREREREGEGGGLSIQFAQYVPWLSQGLLQNGMKKLHFQGCSLNMLHYKSVPRLR